MLRMQVGDFPFAPGWDCQHVTVDRGIFQPWLNTRGVLAISACNTPHCWWWNPAKTKRKQNKKMHKHPYTPWLNPYKHPCTPWLNPHWPLVKPLHSTVKSLVPASTKGRTGGCARETVRGIHPGSFSGLRDGIIDDWTYEAGWCFGTSFSFPDIVFFLISFASEVLKRPTRYAPSVQYILVCTSSTAQGGGGSFKDSKLL